MSRETYKKKYKKHFANSRNLTSGIVNLTNNLSDPENQAKFRDLDFICYEIVNPNKTPSEQLKIINFINETTPINTKTFYEKPSVQELSIILQTWREQSSYEIDGIIVTHNQPYKRENKNPEHAFAYKMVLTDQIAETFVTNVIYTASKDGFLKPRVQFTPVKIGGSTIEYATGFNAAFIRDNNIGIGAKIEIIRSGDVIPYINKVIEPAPEPMLPPSDKY